MKKAIYDNQIFLKKIILIILDILAVEVASILALLVRFELKFTGIPLHYLESAIHANIGVIVLTIFIFYFFHLYSSLWIYASTIELLNIGIAGVLSGICQITVCTFIGNHMPRSYYVLYPIFLITIVFMVRYCYRAIRGFKNRLKSKLHKETRVLVVGAGDAGNSLIKEIVSSRLIHKKVICIVDDDRNKIGNYIHGIKIMGNRYEIPKLVQKYAIDEIIIAISAISHKEAKGILDI